MPLLQINTNLKLDPARQITLLQAASRRVAELLGKSEDYVMVSLQPAQSMLFAGSTEPLAYMELKSIALPQQHTREISAALCQLITEQLDIPGKRIYIEFSDAARSLWGWNGATFER